MTVNELIEALSNIQEAGQGDLPVYYKACYWESVEWATIEGEKDLVVLLDTSY